MQSKLTIVVLAIFCQVCTLRVCAQDVLARPGCPILFLPACNQTTHYWNPFTTPEGCVYPACCERRPSEFCTIAPCDTTTCSPCPTWICVDPKAPVACPLYKVECNDTTEYMRFLSNDVGCLRPQCCQKKPADGSWVLVQNLPCDNCPTWMKNVTRCNWWLMTEQFGDGGSVEGQIKY